MALSVGVAQPTGTLQMGTAPAGSRQGDIFWTGADGNIWYKDGQTGQVSNMGTPQQAKSWDLVLNGAKEIADPVASGGTPSNTNLGGGSTSTAPAPKVLDTAQLGSLDSLINSLGSVKDQSISKAGIKRDTSLREKADEKVREDAKYKGKKLTTLQDFAGATTDTDLNTTSTLENLVSSLSTLGLGGGTALTRQILDAANIANRKANATQATNNQSLDSAFNDYSAGNENDVRKIGDQYGFDEGEANRTYLQGKQNALYKKADVYGAADHTAERQATMSEGDSLNGLISGAAFMNPSYTGETKAMATPDLANYTQDIAKYGTALDLGSGMTPVGGTGGAGNLAVQAIAVNDKDLGVKKRTEGDLGYGV